MTWLTEATRPNRLCYVRASGAFYDSGGSQTTTFDWATSYVKASTGLYDGRLLDPGTVSAGFPETVGGPPERVSTSITVDTTDGGLREILVGTATGDAADEYTGDSVLNLRLTLYHGIKATDGTLYEQQITPTLYCSGSVTFSETTATIPLSSRDEEILGPPKYVHTLRDIKNSTSSGFASGQSCSHEDGSTATVTQATIDALFLPGLAGGISENLDAVAPILMGRNIFPLTLAIPYGAQAVYSTMFIVGVTKTEPSIVNFNNWRIRADTYSEGHPFGETGITLGKIKRRCALTTGPGTTATSDVWVVYLAIGAVQRDSQVETLKQAKLYLVPPSSVAFGMTSGRTANPVRVIQQMIEDWSEGGSSRIYTADFTRAQGALRSLYGAFGGYVRDETTLAEIFTHICEASGLTLWIGRDNKIHCLAGGAWDASDVTAAATALPHLRSDDVLGGYSETIPRGDSDRGSALSRLSIEWSSEQTDFWGSEIQRRAPGGTTLPLSYTNEGRASGAWVCPDKSSVVFSNAGARRAYVTRSISFIAPIWVMGYELGQLFRFSYTFGVGTGTTAGYTQRLCRLTRVELNAAEDTCSVSLDDLGPVAAVKPCVLDTITNWIRYSTTNPIITISVAAGSPTVTATNWNPATAGVTAGDNLWCFGLTDSRDRRSVRVSGNVTATTFDVDFNFYATQAGLAASASTGIDAPWIVMKSQATKTNTTKLTLCREATALFDDGSTSGFRVMGG